MSDSERFPSSYLDTWEAANLVAFGIAAEDGSQQWRENEYKEAGLDPDKVTPEERASIEADETYRFSSAIMCLMAKAGAGSLRIYGRRRHHSTVEPIPKIFWANGEIDPLGDDGGGAHPKFDWEASDSETNEWVGLRYLRSEIEGLRQQILQDTSAGQDQGAQAEAVHPQAEQEPAPDFKLGVQGKSSPLKDRMYIEAIEKVKRTARQEWPKVKKRPPVREMARVLHKKYADELSLGPDAIRGILSGTYSVSRRLDIPGL